MRSALLAALTRRRVLRVCAVLVVLLLAALVALGRAGVTRTITSAITSLDAASARVFDTGSACPRFRHKLGYLSNASLWETTALGRVPLASTCLGRDQSGRWPAWGVWPFFRPSASSCVLETVRGTDALDCVASMPARWVVLVGDSNSRETLRRLVETLVEARDYRGRPLTTTLVTTKETIPGSPEEPGRHSDRDVYVRAGDEVVAKVSLRFVQNNVRLRDVLRGNWTASQWNDINIWNSTAPHGRDHTPLAGIDEPLAAATRGKFPDAVLFSYGLWCAAGRLTGFPESFANFEYGLRHIRTRIATTSAGVLRPSIDAPVRELDEFVVAAAERHGFPLLNLRQVMAGVLDERTCRDGVHFEPFVYRNFAQLILNQLCQRAPSRDCA